MNVEEEVATRQRASTLSNVRFCSVEGLYGCQCGSFFTLPNFFYCQRCCLLRCRFCVTETIQCYYCPSCLQNVASAEAFETDNHCKKCFECPECNTTLKMSERAINTSGQQGASALKEKEHTIITFFQCTFCKWTSLPLLSGSDATNLVEKYAELEKGGPVASSFEELVEKLKKEEHNAKLTRKKRRVTMPSTKQKLFVAGDGFQNLANALQSKEKQLSFADKCKNVTEGAPPFPSSEFPDFGMAEFQEKLTLDQQFINFPFSNVPTKKEMIPHRKLLCTKRSKFCHVCEKVLVKPGINPSAVQYNLRHVALLFIPRFRLAPSKKAIPSHFIQNKPSEIILEINHKVREIMHFKLSQLPENSPISNTKPIFNGNSEAFQYIGPHDFDPEVDLELKDKLATVKSSQPDDNNIIHSRRDSFLYYKLSFIPTGSPNSPVLLGFQVDVKFVLPTGDQATSFQVYFKFGTILPPE